MTEDGAHEAAAEELAIADEELAVAEQLLTSGHHRVAVTRAYFAVFHAVRARLYADGLEPRSHAGVQTLWSSHFVKTERYPTESARVLARLQRYRELADHARDFVVDADAAREDVDAAAALVARINNDLANS